MKSFPKIALVLAAAVCPLVCLAQNEATGMHFKAEVLSVFNIVILITSLIGMRQYFWPGDTDYRPFHVINILMVLLFYSIGLWFLIGNRREYIGYEHLTPGMCIVKFFFSFDLDSLKQWVILAGLIINVLYIMRRTREIV